MEQGSTPAQPASLRARLRVWTETPRFRYAILGLIFSTP